jgi:hypothetical protein
LIPVLTKRYARNLIMFYGMVLAVLALLFLGAEELLYLPDTWYTILIGMLLLGLSHSFAILPFIV